MTDVVLRDGSQALTADWDAGSFQIRAETFQSDVPTGTPPLTVASTTLVGNFNADLLDGQEGSYYLDAGNLTGTLADARVAESNVTQHQSAIDHGALFGRDDDDHTQYLLASGTRALTGDLSAGSNTITNLATPSADADAATKGYVDSLSVGLKWKTSVRVATAGSAFLASSFENGDTIDGVVLSTGDRILIKNQGVGSENGIYTVNASGAPTRATDLTTASGAAGVVTFVEEGTANADTAWVCTNDSGSDVVGTDALTFVQFGGGTTDHGALLGRGDDDHTQYLLASGARALSGNWDAGDYEIRSHTFESDAPTGYKPITIASTTLCTNLNADMVDGVHASELVKRDGTVGLTANWDAGSVEIRARTFQSDVTTATPPFTIASTTVCTNLNADMVDGVHGTNIVTRDGTSALTANWDAGGYQIRALTFYSDVPTGTAPITIASTTLCTNLNADMVDGIEGAALLQKDGSVALTANWDAGGYQIRALTFYSDVPTGTAPITVASTTLCSNLNAQYLNGNASTAFATSSHVHAASDITSGTLAHERGGLEADVSAVAIGDIIAGSGTGSVALVTSTGHSEGDVLTRQSDGSVNYEAPPLDNSVCDGRLTTESGVPYSTSDRTSQSTIYFTSTGKGNRVALYNGSVWKIHEFSERSLALSSLTAGKNYDVFLYDNSGTLTLELSAAWTDDTTRADSITQQDGVYVKSGSTTRRYIGTIRTTGTTTTEDSRERRFVWNFYNQKSRPVTQDASGTTATYSTSTTYRAAGGNSNVRTQVVCGLAGHSRITLDGIALAACASTQAGHVAIGIDSTSSANSDFYNSRTFHNSSVDVDGDTVVCQGATPVTLGYHYYQLLEYQETTTSTSWSVQQLRGEFDC